MELLTDEEQAQVREIKTIHLATYKLSKTLYGETIALKALRDANQQAIGEATAEKVNSSLKRFKVNSSLKLNGSKPQD
jgi:hypothetical protein